MPTVRTPVVFPIVRHTLPIGGTRGLSAPLIKYTATKSWRSNSFLANPYPLKHLVPGPYQQQATRLDSHPFEAAWPFLRDAWASTKTPEWFQVGNILNLSWKQPKGNVTLTFPSAIYIPKSYLPAWLLTRCFSPLVMSHFTHFQNNILHLELMERSGVC